MTKYVIIGNGPAAVSCADGIRSIDKEGSVTIVSKEEHHAYFRPLISYYLKGDSKKEKIGCRKESYYDDNGIKLIYDEAAKIDKDKKKITLKSGKSLPYDKVCICTGSSPFVPPMKGLETVKNKFTFLTIDDSFGIEKAADENSDVLIIGAGLIGLKCAEGLRDRVHQITVCDLAPRVLSSILDDECASVMQKHLEECGIQFSLSNTAEYFENNEAHMKDGSVIKFDILVLALGVRPNISLVKDAGGECGRGIAVESSMKTSLDDIYAAGDCVEQYDITFNDRRIMALLPNANIGGYTAGVNMAGGNIMFDNALPMNSIGFWGLHIMSAGTYSSDENTEMIERKKENSIKRFFIRDDKLIGFMIIGEVKSAGIYTDLIRNQRDLSDIDIDLIIDDPSLMPFGREYRKTKLREEV